VGVAEDHYFAGFCLLGQITKIYLIPYFISVDFSLQLALKYSPFQEFADFIIVVVNWSQEQNPVFR
jgi:hypothetical protein